MVICNFDTPAPKLGWKPVIREYFPKMSVHGKFKIMQNMSCLGVEKKFGPIITVKKPH